MAITFRLRVDGLEKALAELDRVGRDVRDRALPQGVQAMAGVLLPEIYTRSPVDTGFLRSSYAIGPVAYSGSRETVTADIISQAHYAGYVEFGTSRMSARPHVRPALAAARWQMIAAFSRVVRDVIEGPAVGRGGFLGLLGRVAQGAIGLVRRAFGRP